MAINGKPRKTDYNEWSKPELIREVKKLEKRKKYGLVYDEEKVKEVFEEQTQKKLPILKEESSKEVIVEGNTSPHILIEGDNYHVLSVLNYTHKNRIDAIYIDPPYNTGNNSWKYNNRYIEDDDAYKHSKWISFMSKRLQLAKKLLKKNGIICVTIDNHEVHNLRHIMEDVFTDKEIIITVIEHNFRGRTKNNFALTHEYAIWAINKDADLITRLGMGEDIRRNLRRTGNNSKRTDSPSMFYGIEVDKKSLKIIGTTAPLPLDKPIPKHTNPKTEMIYPIHPDGSEKNWYYSPKKLLEEVKKGEAYAKIIKNSIQIHYHIAGKPTRRKSVWSGTKFDASTYGSELLTEIIGENNFPFPKSIHAVKECIEAMTDNKNAIILDFFAGSGTTGHAVLELNKKDNGTRKFILCTNNEGNICDEITLPRLKNVMMGYKFKGKQKEILFEKTLSYSDIKNGEELYEEIEQIKMRNQTKFNNFEIKVKDTKIQLTGIKVIDGKTTGLGSRLKFFKTEFVGWEPTDENKKILVQQSTEMLCLKEDCFELVNEGEQFKIFKNNNDRYLGIIYYYDGIEHFKKEIIKLNKKINTYVFSFSDIVDEEEFQEVDQLVNLKPIPASILNVYRRIFAYVQTKKLSREIHSGTN